MVMMIMVAVRWRIRPLMAQKQAFGYEYGHHRQSRNTHDQRIGKQFDRKRQRTDTYPRV